MKESRDRSRANGASMSTGIALQLYTLREQASEDFTGMLKSVAEAGYGAVEFAGYGELDASALRTIIDNLGLRAISSHVPFQRMVTEPGAVLNELRVLGCYYAIVPGIPKEMRGIESAPYLIERFNQWGAASKAAGLRFGYHNHGWELEPMDGSTMLDRLISGTDAALVDFQIDIYWALVGGADAACQRTGDRSRSEGHNDRLWRNALARVDGSREGGRHRMVHCRTGGRPRKRRSGHSTES
jgi:sugar phosphate isomerase/epimerase